MLLHVLLYTGVQNYVVKNNFLSVANHLLCEYPQHLAIETCIEYVSVVTGDYHGQNDQVLAQLLSFVHENPSDHLGKCSYSFESYLYIIVAA